MPKGCGHTLTHSEVEKARTKALHMLTNHGIVLAPSEASNMEVADFGLGRLQEIGLELIVYINADRYCAKELVLFPRQICPQHRHPPTVSGPGKEETFRCRWGEVYLYLPGTPTENPQAVVPEDKRSTFSVWNEIMLHPGNQYTIPPNTPHWFQGGPLGAIVSEFSSSSTDDTDEFYDHAIRRESVMQQD